MIVAPSWKMLRRSTLDTLLSMIRHADILVSHNRNEARIEIVGGRVIYYAVSKDPDSLRGPNLDWFWLDEADYVSADAVKVMLGRIRRGARKAWFTTSPNPFGWLRRGAELLPGLEVIKAPTYSNPFNSPGFADDLRKQYGEVLARQEIEGEYLDQIFDILIPDHWFDRATSVVRQDVVTTRARLAADLCAGVGRDRFVLMVADDHAVKHVEVSSRITVANAALRIRDCANRFGVAPEACVYDGGGIGQDMQHHLEDIDFLGPRPYFGGARRAEEDRFNNNRSYYAWKLRKRLDPDRAVIDPKARKIDPVQAELLRVRAPWVKAPAPVEFAKQSPFAIPPDVLGFDNLHRLKEEATGLRFHVVQKATCLEEKHKYMERLGRSPDLVDALIMLEAA